MTTAPRLLPQRVVLDCYIDASERVFVIDAAPFAEATDPLLFEWGELRKLADETDETDETADGSATDGADGTDWSDAGPEEFGVRQFRAR